MANATYSVFVDGYAFDHGLAQFVAEGLKELLSYQFPGANLTIVKEK